MYPSALLTLQWGRNLFVAESVRRQLPPADGPRRFNGAATCSLRKVAVRGRVGVLHRLASMGPQLVRCGKIEATGDSLQNIWLQWGRNLFVAERLPEFSRCCDK